jgi:hypothetical protein
VNASLATEREFARKLGQQASSTRDELKAALRSAADLGARNTALQEDLQVGGRVSVWVPGGGGSVCGVCLCVGGKGGGGGGER